MKNIKKRFCFILLFLVAFGFTSCAEVQLKQPPSRMQNIAGASLSNVAQNTSSTKATKEYVFSKELIQVLGRTPEEIIQDLENPDAPNLYTDAWINSEGTITLLVTEEQRQNWITNSKKRMHEYIAYAVDSGFTIQVSKEKDSMTLYIPKNANSLSVTAYMGGAVSQVLINRLFQGIPHEEMGIILTIVNQDTGYVLVQANLPFESFNLMPEDWEISKTRDVVENPLPYEIEGYPAPVPSSPFTEEANALAFSSLAHTGAASLSTSIDASPSMA